MSSLIDTIEAFIVAMLREEDTADLKRNQLAAEFRCAPSQINYVLSTRFTSQRGYIVESRRGGGGYIRIVRMNNGKEILYQAATQPPEAITEESGNALLMRMVHSDAITPQQAVLIGSAISDSALSCVGQDVRDSLRARIFHTMILTLVR